MHMASSISPALRRYLLGLIATFTGAWLTGITGSMWPLALGGAASLMVTLPLVSAIWWRRRRG